MSECNVVDMAEARKRINERKLRVKIRENAKAKESKTTKITQALAKYGHLGGSKSLERMKNLFKKEKDETESNTD